MTRFTLAGWTALAAGAVLLVGCNGPSNGAQDPVNPGPRLKVTSPAFAEGQPIPQKYTAEGADRSPPLSWDAPPDRTRSLVVLVEDADAPGGTFTHWVLFNLPAGTRELPENASADNFRLAPLQGVNDFNKTGYIGPKPPAGKAHRYYFKVFALDDKLQLDGKAKHDQAAREMRGHVLAEGALMGTYQHQDKKD